MKKIYLLVSLLMMTGLIFGQIHTKRVENNTLSAVHVDHAISNQTQTQPSRAVMDSLNYDGPNYDAIGTNAAANFGVYSYFPNAVLSPHAANNYYILSVKIFINGASTVTSSELRFYSEVPGVSLIYSQAFTPVEGWNNVLLTTPMAVPSSGNLLIGYNVDVTGGYPAGCDEATSPNSNGNWMFFGGAWTHLIDLAPTLTYNWNIRAMVGTLPTVPTAACTPLVWNAGGVQISTTATSGTFTLSNAGVGTLTCSGITGLSAPYTTTLVPSSVSLAAGASTTFTFSYNPTVIATNNQTVVIATNGGNITINLNGAGVDCNTPISTFPWVESFESTSFPPACWSAATPNGGTGWARVTEGTTPIPGFVGGTMTVPTGGGTAAAYCNYASGGDPIEQWLITPQIAAEAGQELSFYVFWFGHYVDFLNIKVSTTTTAPASFANVLQLDTTDFVQYGWKKITVPLTAYAGQNIYIAFQEYTDDGAIIGLDLVTIAGPATNPIAACTPLAWDAGTVEVGQTATSGNFTLSNAGVGTLTCSGITGLSVPYTTTLVPATVSLAAGAEATFTFTYEPTAVATDNQTVVIATNGGDITINLTGKGVDDTGIFDNTQSLTTIFPNPAESSITITTIGNTLVTISDLTGRIVYSAQINGTENVSIEEFNAGIYIVKSENNGIVETTKLIVR